MIKRSLVSYVPARWYIWAPCVILLSYPFIRMGLKKFIQHLFSNKKAKKEVNNNDQANSNDTIKAPQLPHQKQNQHDNIIQHNNESLLPQKPPSSIGTQTFISNYDQSTQTDNIPIDFESFTSRKRSLQPSIDISSPSLPPTLPSPLPLPAPDHVQEIRPTKRKLEDEYERSEQTAKQIHRPLSLSNVGATCYLNSGLQVLYCAQGTWQGQGDVTGLLAGLSKQKMVVNEFVTRLEPHLKIGQLRSCNDTRKVICAILGKVSTENSSSVSRLEFTKLTKTYKCSTCGKQETVNPRGPPNSYYRYIDGTSVHMTKRIEDSFARQRNCMDCPCTEDVQENQQELIYYEKYPKVALLCTLSPPAVRLERHITLGNLKYELIGYALSLDGHAVAVVQHSQKWYMCDDARIKDLKDPDTAVRVAEQMNGEPILFAYKQIKSN